MLALSVSARSRRRCWCRLHRALHAGDAAAAADWNARLLRSRETRELRAETAQMGHSLRRLMEDSGEFEGGAMIILRSAARGSVRYGIQRGVRGMADRTSAGADRLPVGWLENQVVAA